MLKLKNILVMLFVAVIVAGSANANTLLWSEEFDGTSVDTSKWIIFDEADGSDSWYAPHNVEVSNGTLKLHNREESYEGRSWTGGHIDALYYPQYKYLEARVRHSAADTNIWATWWTIGWNGTKGVWPPEFDICEFQGNSSENKSPGQWYHYLTSGGYHTWSGASTGMNESQWHTYGVYWNATDSPIFYVDGAISEIPGLGSGDPPAMAAKLKLTSSPNSYTRYSGCSLGTMEVDWVRVYDVPPDGGTTTTTSAPADNDPVVSFTNPSSYDTLTDTVAVNAVAYDSDVGTSDGDGISNVVFELLQGSTVIDSKQENIVTYDWSLDTTDYDDGAYTLKATATASSAAGGTSTSTTISVTIANGGGTTTTTATSDNDPVVSFTNPSSGATLTDTVAVNAVAYDPDVGTSDGDGISNVVFELLQGSTVIDSKQENIVTYDWSLDTTDYDDGAYTLKATATASSAAGGTSASTTISVTIANGGGTTTTSATTTTTSATTTSGGGGNLALNKPVVASSIEASRLAAEKAVDGDDDTRWSSEDSDPQWIYVDLQATSSINQVKIHWQRASAEEYKVQVASSSSGPWTDCAHITGNDEGDHWATHNFSTRSARYVRMYGIQRTTSYGYSIYELEVYGP